MSRVNPNLRTGPIGSFQSAHEASDTDLEAFSLHHTLGSGPQQAAPGNHTHNSIYTPAATILSHRCRAKKTDSTTQAVATSTDTTVTLDTTEYDPSSMFDNANDRIVIPADGLYAVTGTVHWDVPAAACPRALDVRVGGVVVASGTPQFSISANNRVSNASGSWSGYCTASQNVDMIVWQNSGANLNIEGWNATGSRCGCYLTVIRIA